MSKKKHRKSSSSSSSKRSKRGSDSSTSTVAKSSSSSTKKKSEKSKSKSSKKSTSKSDQTAPIPAQENNLSTPIEANTQSQNLADKDLLDTQLMKAPEVPSQTSADAAATTSFKKSSSSKRKKKSRSNSRTKEEKKIENISPSQSSLVNSSPDHPAPPPPTPPPPPQSLNKIYILELGPTSTSSPISPSTIPLPSPQPVPPPQTSLETLLKPVNAAHGPFAPMSTKKPIKIEIKAESKQPLLLPNVFSSPALLESFSPPTPPHQQQMASFTKSNYSAVTVSNTPIKDESKVN